MEAFELEDAEKPYSLSHRCFYFSKDVLLFIRECKYEKIHFSLFDQLVRSATSIGANIVEGKAGSSRKDWRKYYNIALKSANETKYWLYLIRETIIVSAAEINKLITEVNELSKIIASILLKTK